MTEGQRLERYVRLRWGRKQGGIRALAEACETSPDTVYRWFKLGTAKGIAPDTGDLSRLATALRVLRYQVVAAMDGVGTVVALDEETRSALRSEIEAALDERLGPRREPRGRSGAA